MDVKSWDELRERVEESENVLTCKMRKLRDLHGAKSLGSQVTQTIMDQLKTAGLGHVPLDLPTHGGKKVRLYTLGSELGDLITKAMHPGNPQDESLRQRVKAGPAHKLKQIRSIVCEGEPEMDG